MTKPGIAAMVLLSTGVGAYLAAPEPLSLGLWFGAILGVGLAGSASSVLNQVLERDLDARMQRTSDRPLPAGRLTARQATLFGIVLGSVGVGLLLRLTNPLTAALAAATLLAYLFIYTPLKQKTSWNTLAGAVPGAMPPLLGWTAVRGEIELGGLVLFVLLFLWQLPHFLSIAWLYRDDYRRGGFRMATLHDSGGERTGRSMTVCCAFLLVASLLPTLTGMAGSLYLVGALAFGGWFLVSCMLFWKHRTRTAARSVLGASLAYLPVALGLLAAGL
jgi:protoheme IX farnesyltransferase